MKKKLFLIGLCVVMMLALLCSFGVGAGDVTIVEGFYQDNTKKEFRVSTSDALMAVANHINIGGFSDYTVIIEADIDMEGFAWTPIANKSEVAYSGTVKGQGHVIKNLYVNSKSGNVGLIGYAASGGSVEDLHLENVNIASESAYVGAMVGCLTGASETGKEFVISNCTVTGSISTSANYAGGLVGALVAGEPTSAGKYYAPNLRVENCAVNVSVSATVNYASGILGGEAFAMDEQEHDRAMPRISMKNVFVAGSCSSPNKQAANFLCYNNRAQIILENCIGVADIVGSDTLSGSIMSRARFSEITLNKCYTLAKKAAFGELESVFEIKANDCYTVAGSKLCKVYTCAYDVDGFGSAPAVVRVGDTTVRLGHLIDKRGTIEYPDEIRFSYKSILYGLPSLERPSILFVSGELAGSMYSVGTPQRAITDAYFGVCECVFDAEVAHELYLAVPATCTEQGQYYRSCAKCGAPSFDMNNVFYSGNMAVHDYSARVAQEKYFASPATCTEKAKYYISCVTCGASSGTLQEVFEVGDYAPHDFTAEVVEERYLAAAATCTEKAKYYASCADCGTCSYDPYKTFSGGATAPHDFTAELAEERYLASAATCTEKARYYASCVACGKSSDSADSVFEAGELLPHAFEAHVAEQGYLAAAATCTEKAKYYASCSACGESEGALERAFEHGDTLPHDYTAETVDEKYLISVASCTVKAKYYRSCAACGRCADDATLSFETGELLPHAYDASVIDERYLISAASCTNGAIYYKSCVVCAKSSESLESVFVGSEPLGHSFSVEDPSEANLMLEANCERKAKYYKTCVVCGERSTDGADAFEYGEPLGHSYATEWESDEYLHWHACVRCADKTDRGGHNFGEWKTEIEATPFEEGVKARVCAQCEYREEDTIAKLPIVNDNDNDEGDDAGGNAGGSTDNTLSDKDDATDNGNGDENGKSGCGGSIGGASVLITLCALGAAFARKKKE